jgi:Flp pilus assembly protein TadD
MEPVMPVSRRCKTFDFRRMAAIVLVMTLALALAGCMKAAPGEMTASGRPDWRVLSDQGAALDQMGRHEEAQRYYGTALRIAPDEPSVLSNLGLSYALSKDLVRAEATLRRAAGQGHANSHTRRSLALVVGLQGRFAEAESIARSDLTFDAVTADVAVLRQMLAQQNGWSDPRQPVAVKAEGS